MQITSIDHLTTVAYNRSPAFSAAKRYSPFNALYFQFTLRFKNESFNAEEREKIKRYLRAKSEFFGGDATAVGFSGDRIRLLVALPPQTTPEGFIERLRIISKAFVRRKLDAERFFWKAEYEISTVSFSQIGTIRHDIERKDRAMSSIAPRLAMFETID